MSSGVKRATTPPASLRKPARSGGQARELIILVSFLVITALGVVTVLLPETENQKDPEAPARAAAEAKLGAAAQSQLPAP